MPVHRGVENGKPFYQWGQQKKYFYKANNKRSRILAKQLATLQGKAIHVNK
jgi:hypothetical protein